MPIELTPEILFSLVVGAPLVLIIGMGTGLALILYLLDREVRKAEVEPAPGETAVQTESRPEPVAAAAGPSLSAASQRLLSGGTAEPPTSMGLPHDKMGMWVFLASEVMFFTALIGAFVAFRAAGRITIPVADLNVNLAALNTFLLIVSSFTVVLALDAIQENKINRFVLFLLATLGLGGAFISLQGVEWAELLAHGVTPTESLFGTAFFVTTGFHGAHVAIGLIWLTFAVLKAFRGDFTAENNMGIELFGLYWHFVDIVWIILFTIIYLI